ncbi:MAG TPA: ATP-dependent Clp protease adaptor ClpS, partial [Polyangiales bacterium]|nr:ATP-dependent Clp protease adaptor ClpS [Polyangiales bacterium]
AEDRDNENETGIVTRTKTKAQPKTAKPPLYRVLLHNDDYTTREFVVEMLKGVFHRPEAEAIQIMLHVHQNGVGVAGIYTYEVAEVKVRTVESLARQREFPLMLSIEPEE